MRAAEPPFVVRDMLGGITAPTLVITGAHDFICGPAWGRLRHEGIADSRLVLLEDSGHLGHIEQPGTFASAITEFTREATHAATR
ncbi:alpha/beta hydrolase [Microtetraspora sp. NBRC 16547]|uniref:alpha/beta fold hydrolase n=1 Tax=Microtetraspora sp. NBRC 16547 TaxID=3030993 RepID=UPI0025533214|nr:alpha/beta hydrolase [Microtetraspora sp. NBRC 16547]